MTEKPTANGITIQTIVSAAAIGLFGFLASDFIKSRDARTNDVERDFLVRLDLKLEPLKSSLTEVKTELRTAVVEVRQRTDALNARLSGVEHNAALQERSYKALVDRFDRLSAFVRERSLERIEE